ncbi:hypothetical protein IFM46972_09042 [Aspergillus udagawae]|uniref:Uncharacterized protein n=1 Tax=Aspergillus udagawae TaxID=91492 RepID=A0A8H3PAT5_9EURO|nr:hypothetical protein IFM46972_09042 [Aspergillus udagawae]
MTILPFMRTNSYYEKPFAIPTIRNMESHYAQCAQADRDLQRAIHDQDLRFDQIENLLNTVNNEFKLCKAEIGQWGDSTETTTPPDTSANASSSFQTAQSHLIPSDEGAAALRAPPRLPFLQLP